MLQRLRQQPIRWLTLLASLELFEGGDLMGFLAKEDLLPD